MSREELSPLIDDEDANEQLPLKDIESFPRKKSSTFSSKSPDKESTSTSMFKFPSVSENHESSVEGTTTIDIEPFDSLDDYQNRRNINEVPNITVTMPSEERHELQELEYGNHLHHRLESTSSPSRAKVPNITVSNEEEHHEPQGLTSSQFFSYIYNICEGEGFDKTDFYQKIDLLHAKHRLYDVLLSQNENGDTLLHVAIKKGKIDLTKEILHILDEPYKLDSFYKDKYFEREKPLFKVVSTKNKERKSVITLVIEGNDLEHIAAVFEYLACDEETKQLLIGCCGEVNNLSKKLVDIDKKSARTKRSLSVAESAFALFAGIGFIVTVCDVIYYYVVPDNTSRATIKYTSPCNTTDTSPCNTIIEYKSLPSFTSENSFRLLAAFTSAMITLKYVINKVLSRYEKKDSILEERLKSCMEKRDKLGSELESALKYKVYTEEVGNLKEELHSLRESCSTQMNSVFVQLTVPSRDSAFNSPNAQI